MKYALNIRKGTIINHPNIKLHGLIAEPVDDKLALQLKNIHDIIIFDDVRKPKKEEKTLYGLDKETLQ